MTRSKKKEKKKPKTTNGTHGEGSTIANAVEVATSPALLEQAMYLDLDSVDKETTPQVPNFSGFSSSASPSETEGAAPRGAPDTEEMVQQTTGFDRMSPDESLRQAANRRSWRHESAILGLSFIIGTIVLLYVAAYEFLLKQPKALRACSSADCAEALTYINSIVNHSLDPCDNFYVHVCSRWLGNRPRPAYLDEVRTDFKQRTLLALQKGHHKDHAVRFVSLVFQSCNTFFATAVDVPLAVRRFFEVNRRKTRVGHLRMTRKGSMLLQASLQKNTVHHLRMNTESSNLRQADLPKNTHHPLRNPHNSKRQQVDPKNV